MELVMWIVVGIVAGLACIVLVPVLVVGTWFVVITVILGLADGALWLLDQGWKKKWKDTSVRRTSASGKIRGIGEDVDTERVAQVACARP